MKKKGLIVLLLLVVMIGSIALSGCTLVKLNSDRQAGRVMATVSYEVNVTNQEAAEMLAKIGITDFSVGGEINRRELLSSTNYSINSMASLYEQYSMTYNYDFKTVLGDTLDSLVANNYYVLRAIEYLLNNSSTERLESMYMFCRPDDYKAVYGNKLSVEGVLTMSEWYSAVGSVNSTLQTMLDGYVESKEDGVRNDRISAADNKISEYYEQGYFVSDVYLVKNVVLEEGEEAKEAFKNAAEEKGKVVVYDEDGEKYVSGLYVGDKGVVLTGKVDSDDSATDAPASSELDYNKVYAAIEMTKKNGGDVVYVPRPASEASLSIARVTDADFAGKYIRTRSVTVSYSGRVYAEKTEDNDSGYTSKTFTSDAVEYKVAFPRNALEEKAEEIDYLEKEEVRYATKDTWNEFYTYIAEEGNYDSEKKELVTDGNAAYDALEDDKKELYKGLASLYTAPFTMTYSGDDKNVKDGYRQLRNTLSSAGIGFVESEPADKNSAEYASYKYYSGIYDYYNEQFRSVSLDAVKYEIGLAVKNDPAKKVSDNEVLLSYVAKVSQDKAKYDSLSYADQIDKFFSNTTSIDGVYYVPMKALSELTYEIDPNDKSYKALFTFNPDKTVSDWNRTYVTKTTDGKYTMKYIYKNDDGTYTINAFFVGALLFSFGNDEDINNAVKIDNGKLVSVAGYSDLSEEKQVELLNKLVDQLETRAQITEDGTLQEEVTEIDQLYGEEKKSVRTIIDEIKNAINGKNHDEILEVFKKYMAMYNDDSGKLNEPGYLITSGDVKDSWAMADFPNGAREIYYNLLAGGVNPNEAVANVFGEGMTYYGLHYMMVTFAPYYRVELMKINIDGEECYALPMDMAYNLAGDTQAAKIREGLEEAKISSEYSAWQASFEEETINSATVKNDKNYKSLIKDIEKESKR